MSANWLLDDELDPHYDKMAAAIAASGGVAKKARRPEPPYTWDDVDNAFLRYFPHDACVVVWGDIDLVNRVQQADCWRPGTFATIEHYFCSHYYPQFRPYLFNYDSVLLPFNELSERREKLFAEFGRDDRLFIRPDSPLKTFTGQVATRATFDRDLEFMAFYEFPVEDSVVVSSPKPIINEWRFVIVEQQVVSGSRYKQEDKFVQSEIGTGPALDLATEIAARSPQPDPVWVLDICETADQQFRLLEIGGFSFAGLYDCDRFAVVNAVAAVALRIHQRGRQVG